MKAIAQEVASDLNHPLRFSFDKRGKAPLSDDEDVIHTYLNQEIRLFYGSFINRGDDENVQLVSLYREVLKESPRTLPLAEGEQYETASITFTRLHELEMEYFFVKGRG